MARSLNEIGAGVIGTGFIGTVHLEALRRIGVDVQGVLGSSAERGAQSAQRLSVRRAYASLDEMLSDERVEVVHVTSPNKLHYPQVKQILAAGRHVVCEKPLAMDARESGELVALARDSGKVAAVNFNIRFYPLNQHLRASIAAGDLGEVRLISGHYFQDWLLLDTDWNWRLDPREGGALRAVGDIGSHWLDLTSFVSGLHVTEVMADLATFIQTRQQPKGPVETYSRDRIEDTVETPISTEDVATILLRYENGARGVVAISQVSPGRKNSLEYEIDGSAGSARWDSESPDVMWLGHRDRPSEIMPRDARLMTAAGQDAAALPAGHVEGFADTFAALFRAVYADVLNGGIRDDPPYATFPEGHEEMLVGDAVARSAREGRWMEVEGAGQMSRTDDAIPTRAGA